MADSFSIKSLARTIRYRELSNLIGREITVHSIEGIIPDIQTALVDSLPNDSRLIGPQSKSLRVMIAKYGIIDLEFEVESSNLSSGFRKGISVLKELGFVIDPKSAEESASLARELFGDESDDPTCLTQLGEELKQGKTVMRLFLRSERIQGMGSHLVGHLPSDYFPKLFTLEDACIANSGFVWFHKHFYV